MKLKLAAIGIGMAWDRLHYPALKELSDKYEIVAVCNKSVDKAQGFAQGINLPPDRVYSDYREMLKRADIDVVDVLVPISENFEVARDVLAAGKNLIAEKPFAATMEGAKQLVELKNKHKLKVMVAENMRYDDGVNIVRQIVAGGQLGKPLYFIMNTAADFEKDKVGDTFAAKEWRQHPEFEGGIFLDGGIHDIALMRHIFGDALCVRAMATPSDKEYCPYGSIASVIKFSSGAVGSYTFYCGGELQKPPVGLRVFCTLGDIFLESKECGTVSVNYSGGKSEQITFTPSRGYYNELLNFHGGDIVSTPEAEVGDMQLVFDILNEIKACK